MSSIEIQADHKEPPRIYVVLACAIGAWMVLGLFAFAIYQFALWTIG